MEGITLKAMPFDSNELLDPQTGETTFDRVAYSRDLADWMRTYFSNGVLVKGGNTLGNQMKVVHKEALTLTVKTGEVCINGRTGWLEEDTDLTVEMGGSNPRIDRIVAELNIPNDRGIYIKVLQGTPAASPTAPALTRTEDVYQMSLAQVRVNASSATVTTVSDERSGSYCGISNVTVGIKPPTGDDAKTVKLSDSTKALYGKEDVDSTLVLIKSMLNTKSELKIAYGSYTGNATVDRNVTVSGLNTISMVIVFNGVKHAIKTNFISALIGDNYPGSNYHNNATLGGNTNYIVNSNNTFKVSTLDYDWSSGFSTNSNGILYSYIALGI